MGVRKIRTAIRSLIKPKPALFAVIDPEHLPLVLGRELVAWGRERGREGGREGRVGG